MYQNCCNKCGSTDLFTEKKLNSTGLYCSDCGAWQKWLGKDELKAFQNAKTKEKLEKQFTGFSQIYKMLDVLGVVYKEGDTFVTSEVLSQRLKNKWDEMADLT